MPRTAGQWFNPADFPATPANGQWGNAGRGIIEGPGYVLFNLGLQKTVRLERAGSLQLVASFQNVLNPCEPRRTIRWRQVPCLDRWSSITPMAAPITATSIFPPAGSPRTGQFGLRWDVLSSSVLALAHRSVTCIIHCEEIQAHYESPCIDIAGVWNPVRASSGTRLKNQHSSPPVARTGQGDAGFPRHGCVAHY